MWSIKRSPAVLLGACAAAAAALAGCQTTGNKLPPHPQFANAPTELDQYRPVVVATPERLALAPHAQGLSPRQDEALAAYAAHWREGADEVIEVDAPAGRAACGCDPAATARAAVVRLQSLGVPAAYLRLGSYDPGPTPGAPVTLGYSRYTAKAQDCDDNWDNLSSTNSNGVSTHFGCAMAKNMAALVADPRDLEQPRREDPADGMRRGAVLDKYRLGQVTSSAKDDQASGAVSNAVH